MLRDHLNKVSSGVPLTRNNDHLIKVQSSVLNYSWCVSMENPPEANLLHIS